MCKLTFKLVQNLVYKIYNFSYEVVIKQSDCGEAFSTSVLTDSEFSAAPAFQREYSPV